MIIIQFWNSSKKKTKQNKNKHSVNGPIIILIVYYYLKHFYTALLFIYQTSIYFYMLGVTDFWWNFVLFFFSGLSVNVNNQQRLRITMEKKSDKKIYEFCCFCCCEFQPKKKNEKLNQFFSFFQGRKILCQSFSIIICVTKGV